MTSAVRGGLLALTVATGCAHQSVDPTAPSAPSPWPTSAPGASAVDDNSARTGAAPAAGTTPPRTCAAWAAPGVLRRQAVTSTVDAGLGRWLQGIAVAPARQGSRFAGWKVVALPDDGCYQNLDLRPGDVVTRVNGSTLERPDDAQAVFQSLRTAAAVDVDLRRADQARHLHLPIRD